MEGRTPCVGSGGDVGERNGRLVDVRAEATCAVQEDAGLSLAEAHSILEQGEGELRGKQVEVRLRERVDRAAGSRLQRAAAAALLEEDLHRVRDEQRCRDQGHHGGSCDRGVGRTSRGGDGRRLGAAQWCRGLDEADDAEQAQQPNHQPSRDSECSHDEPLSLGSHTGLCGGIIVLLSRTGVNDNIAGLNRSKMIR